MKNSSDVLEAQHAAGAVRWTPPRLAGGMAHGSAGEALPTARELDALERGAYDEGLARGRADGYAAGLAEAQQHVAQLRRILDHFERPLAELGSELEQIIVHLATAVAGALTRGLTVRQPELVAALVREAMAALPGAARDVEVQLHAEDLPLVQALLAEREPALRLTANPHLARGDVRVASDLVRLDATLPTRLANAAEALLSKGTP